MLRFLVCTRVIDAHPLNSRRLWHQLTLKIEQIIEQPQWKPELTTLYHGFIEHFESKLNQLTLVKIAVNLSKSHTRTRLTNCIQRNLQVCTAADATEFLTKIAAKTTDPSALVREAHILAVSEVALLKLRVGKLDECKTHLADAKKLLDNLTGVDSVVYASYYLAAAELAKRKSTAAEFYKNALLFLAYANIDRIPADERKAFAFDLVVSALVGENVYSFGELVRSHRIASPSIWTLTVLCVDFAAHCGRACCS